LRTETLTMIDLFAAPGGLSLGFHEAGFRPLVAVDIDERGMLTYSHNFPHAKILSGAGGDVREIGAEQLLEAAGMQAGEVDVVVGGPPCQGFSTIGRVKIASLVRVGTWNHMRISQPRFIDDPRNELYKHFVRIVAGVRPKFFVMENVPGMKSYRDGEIVRDIVEDFTRIGYRVLGVEVLNAVWYGVPQRRKRIFFVGTRLRNVRFSWPVITHLDPLDPETPPATVPRAEKVAAATTVGDAILDLPPPLDHRSEDVEVPYPDDDREISEYARLMRRPAPDGRRPGGVFNHVSRFTSERDRRVFGSPEFREGMWWRDLPEHLKRMYGYRDDIFHDKIKRLDRRRPSWTVVAHLYKDGYMYVHPTEPRTITVREAARLQSFPDWFRFMGSRTDQFKQVGNAVPPLMAKAVALEVRKALLTAED